VLAASTTRTRPLRLTQALIVSSAIASVATASSASDSKIRTPDHRQTSRDP
jgi:hypothetical protein